MTDRPRTRFDAIAEEMAEEPMMTTPETAGVVIDEIEVTCSACKLSAFEVRTDVQRIVCLACPDHPVTSYPGDVTKIVANRYHCGRCGHEPLVTMTLTDVNLYCRRCAQLTLHMRPGSMEPKAQPPRRKLTRKARARFDELLKTYTTRNPEATAPGSASDGPALWKPMSIDATVEAMRRTLGLDDFEEFRAKARKRNADLAVLSGEDLDLKRGSGRTTRGILQALAACLTRETEVLWVCGHRPSYDADLRRLCMDLAARLRLAHPILIRTMPDSLLTIQYPRGLNHLYVDHSFYDSRNDRRLDVVALYSIVDAQERS